MAIKVETQDKDYGFAQFSTQRFRNKMSGREVKVGIMGEGEVLEYAMYNEFGTSKIPARPFMQTTYDRNEAEIHKFVTYLAGQIVDGKSDVDRALNVLGMTYQRKGP